MKQKVTLTPIEFNVSTNNYLNGSNIVQGLPVSSQINNPQTNQIQSNQVIPPPAIPIAVQPTQITTVPQFSIDQVFSINQVEQVSNRDDGSNYQKFSSQYLGYSLLHLVFFIAEIFIQRFMYGYQDTFTSLAVSYAMLLIAVVSAYRGSKKRRKCTLYVSLGFLFLFIFLQILGFIYAAIYPIRYSFDNSAANDAMDDYNYYYSSQQQQNNHDDYYDRNLAEAAYSMSAICQILQRNLANFSQKSYYEYCQDVLKGKVDDNQIDRFSPLQIGLLIYYIAGILAAILLTYVLARMTYKYGQYIEKTIRCYPESPSSPGSPKFWSDPPERQQKKKAPPPRKKSRQPSSKFRK